MHCSLRNPLLMLIVLMAVLTTGEAFAQRMKSSGCPDDWGTPHAYLNIPDGYNYAYFCVTKADDPGLGCLKVVGGPFQMFFGTSTKDLEDKCNAIDGDSGVQARLYGPNPKDKPIPPQLCKKGEDGKVKCGPICKRPEHCLGKDNPGRITLETPHGPS